MFRIVVSLREKRSTSSQFENVSVGCDIEADHLELCAPEEILGRARQLFKLARSAVDAELVRAAADRSDAQDAAHAHTNGRWHGHGHANGHGPGGDGRGHGRPVPEPSAKQKTLLHRLAVERGLSAQDVGDIARREFGRDVPQLDKGAMSRLLELLMEQEARP